MQFSTTCTDPSCTTPVAHKFLQRWSCVQQTLMPELTEQLAAITPKLERLIHVLEWVRIEEFVQRPYGDRGRPPHERAWLANAFVAKALLGLPNTAALLERLHMDRSLRRICGFALCKRLPSESTFSRAFDEFARGQLAQRVHEALIKDTLGQSIIGHVCRDATAIEGREKVRKPQTPADTGSPVKVKRQRGRPRKGEQRPSQDDTPCVLAIQQSQGLEQMLAGIPRHCNRGVKCNAQGYKNSWSGFKLHIDTADCGVPLSALLSSASVHDSRCAIPLSRMSEQRVHAYLYDVQDAAYCSEVLRSDSLSRGRVPLTDHNPRKGQKIEFAPHEAQRYKVRSAAERTNARLKEEFGADNVMVKGADKVMSHLMFGLLVLSADQLMRLRQ
jgi:hypothetical protein